MPFATCGFFYQEVGPISPLVTCIGQWKAAEITMRTICSLSWNLTPATWKIQASVLEDKRCVASPTPVSSQTSRYVDKIMPDSQPTYLLTAASWTSPAEISHTALRSAELPRWPALSLCCPPETITTLFISYTLIWASHCRGVSRIGGRDSLGWACTHCCL